MEASVSFSNGSNLIFLILSKRIRCIMLVSSSKILFWLSREGLHGYQFKKCILYPNTHFNLYLKHPKLGHRFEWIFYLKSLQKPTKVLQTWGHYLILLSVQRLQKKTKTQLKQFLSVDKKWHFFCILLYMFDANRIWEWTASKNIAAGRLCLVNISFTTWLLSYTTVDLVF